MDVSSRIGARVAVVASLLAAVGIYAAAFSAETPVGSLTGTLIAADTGRPLVGVSVHVRPLHPKDGGDVRTVDTDESGRFSVRRLPAGDYQVAPATSVYENKEQPVAVTEGRTASLEFRLDPEGPFLNLNIHQHTYLPEENPRIALHGFRQGDEITVRIVSVDAVALVRDYGSELRALLNPVSSRGQAPAFVSLKNRSLREVRSLQHRITERDAEGVFYSFVRLGKLTPGLYLISARGEKQQIRPLGGPSEGLGWLMVTDLALVTKTTRDRVLAFTTDLRTGKPVAGASVVLYRGRDDIARGVSDARGIADLRHRNEPGSDEVTPIARRGDSFSFMRLYLYDDGERRKQYRVFSYTDRPVYRPGHRVSFKGVARRLQGYSYSVPSPRTVAVRVTDYQDTEIFEGTAAMNERGSFAGEFELPKRAASGPYTLSTKIDGEEHTHNFAVAAYRKPEWRVDVTTEKKSYIRGERVPVTVEAKYYYGSPVVDGKVTYVVYRSPYWRWWGDEEDADFYASDEESEGGSGGEIVVDGEATTDGDGQARFEFPTSLAPADDASMDYEYSIEAYVTDASERQVNGSGKARVVRGDITVTAEPERYLIAPRESTTVVARARDLDEKPVAGLTLTATTVRQTWVNAKLQETVLATSTVTTDAKGETRIPVVAADAGSVVVRLTGTDRRGNRIVHEANIYVSRYGGDDGIPVKTDLAVTTDRKMYRAGQTAQVLVTTDKPGTVALVAIEAESVMDYRLVPLIGKSTIVRFPIRAEYEPNVYVSACFVRSKEFFQSSERINVNVEAHKLNVSVTSDREVYRPRDSAKFEIRTTDHRGRPVAAELSFGVVDEAVYAIREEPSRGMWETFYPRRRNEVRTDYSFPQIYLGDADKDGPGETVRKDFPDTAYWNPFLTTDAAGRATVTVPLKDSLTSWRATAVAHTPRTEVGKTVHNIRVMKDLTLRLQVPRSLTEGDQILISALAHNYTSAPMDIDVELKAAGAEVRSDPQKRVRVEPGLAERVEWSIEARSVGTATFTAVARAGALSDGMELTVPVRAFARERVDYRTGALSAGTAKEELSVDPTADAGEAEVRLSPTLAGSLLGSLEYLASYPYGCTEQTMSSFLPNVAIGRSLRELELRQPELEQKLPAMVQAGLLRLYQYQHQDGGWGWWEYDETDPWMTAYVIYGLTLAKDAGYDINERILENGLNRARELSKDPKLELDEGSFLAYALVRAKAARSVRPLIARLLERHKRTRMLPAPPPRTGQPPTYDQKLVDAAEAAAPLRRRSLGYLALALSGLSDADSRRSAAALMKDLWSKAIADSGLLHWEEPERHPWDWSAPQSVETTAVLFEAATRLAPGDERLREIVRWLMLQRHGNRWESTRDTSFILLALSGYLRSTGELKPDYRVSVLLNGREIHTDAVSPGDALKPETVFRIPFKDLAPENRIEVRREGEGTVYYAVQLTQQLRAASFAPESSRPGLSVSRAYYLLEKVRDAQGRRVVRPASRPADRFQVGDRILVRLTVRSDQEYRYLMVEDPLPAGWEVQDRGDVSPDEWTHWWSHIDVRDDRVSLFLQRLPPGEHRIEYYVRVEVSGAGRALPAVLSDMYVPATRASTGDVRLVIAR